MFLLVLGLSLVAIVCIVLTAAFSRSSRTKLLHSITRQFASPPGYTDYPLGSIASYHALYLAAHGPTQVVDRTTWEDLEMDGVYKQINICGSSVGEEYLYHMLHLPQFDDRSLAARKQLMDYLAQNPELRLSLQLALHRLGKCPYSGVSGWIFDKDFPPLPNAPTYRVLSYLPLVGLLLLPLQLGLGVFVFLAAAAVNLLVHYTVKRQLVHETVTLSYLSSILYCCKQIDRQTPADFSGFKSEMLAALGRLSLLCGRASALFKQSLSELDIFSGIAGAVFLLDINHYSKAMDTLHRHPDDIETVYRFLGDLESAIAVLSLRGYLPYFCEPSFAGTALTFEDIYHPLLAHPVANSGAIANDSIITGSNASGKSTFIKALAINGIFAQTILTCTATRFAVFYALTLTSMAVRDDVTASESYFIAEIKSLKRIVDAAAAGRCCCYIDEILKGTNTIERIAASAAMLTYLHKLDGLCLVASHDIELTEILKDCYDNYHFSEQVTESGVAFDYKLKPGPSRTRNAILLLDYLDFAPEIVAEADRLAARFVADRSWPHTQQ